MTDEAASAAPRPALRDRFRRTISYLRLSITDLCNFRCDYCMPRRGVVKLAHAEILRNEEFVEVVRAMAALGVTKVRITGGEPLVRRGAIGLIRELVAIDGIETVALTTNGERLAELAEPLKETSLARINVSIDSLDPPTFSRITHGGDLGQVIAGVDRALELGFPLKINTVLLEGLNTHALGAMVDFARSRGIGLRFIELMTFDSAPTRFSEADAVELLSRDHRVEPLPRDPDQLHVRRYAVDGTQVGFISPLSHSFCGDCNKLRLTPDGGLRVCLASNLAVDLRSVLRRPHTGADLERAIRLAVAQKPQRAEWGAPGEMWKVGG